MFYIDNSTALLVKHPLDALFRVGFKVFVGEQQVIVSHVARRARLGIGLLRAQSSNNQKKNGSHSHELLTIVNGSTQRQSCRGGGQLNNSPGLADDIRSNSARVQRFGPRTFTTRVSLRSIAERHRYRTKIGIAFRGLSTDERTVRAIRQR